MPQTVADGHDRELAAAPDAAGEAGLSDRELRKLRFIERRPWVAPLAIAFFWIIFVGSSWYQMNLLIEKGAEFGLATPGDLWQLVTSWKEQKRLFHPYEVLVLEKINTAVWQAGTFFMATCFILASSYENRLVLKLWRTLRGRR